ncbi:MAG: hypothetical protein RL115_2487 [Bacteroidota bacterium]
MFEPSKIKKSKMKKITIAASLLMLVATTLNAQDIPQRNVEHPKMMHKEHGKKGERLDWKALDLTDAQKNQLKANREAFRTQMDELKKLDHITVKEQRIRMEALKEAQKNNLASVLTQAQKDKMKTQLAQRQATHNKRMNERGALMKEQLGLTNEQAAQLEKNRTAAVEKMKSIRENKSLTPQQKKEQLQVLHQQQKNELKNVLSADQLKKLKENTPHRKGPHSKEDKPTSIHKTI